LNSRKEQTLHETLQAIHKRLGKEAIAIGSKGSHTSYISTGFLNLDSALGGGLPRGRFCEVSGKPTSGATSVALQTMAQAQQAGDMVVYLDLSSTFDPSIASQFGVRVADMLLVRPVTPLEAMDILFDVVSSGLPGLLILNPVLLFTPADRAQLAAVLRRLHPKLTQSRCVFLLLSQPHLASEDLTQIATIRLMVKHDQWMYDGRDVIGYRARISIQKHKLPKSRPTEKTITVTINHPVNGDPR
jgi:recombination protein RecA